MCGGLASVCGSGAVTMSLHCLSCCLVVCRVVCGGVSVCGVCSVGSPFVCHPLALWMVGWHCGWWGGIVDGGVAVSSTFPVCALASPLFGIGVPLVVCMVAVSNSGGVLCCGVPVFGLGPPFRIALASLLSCVAVFVVGGEVWWCVPSVYRGVVPCVSVCAICCGVRIVAWCGVWYCTVEERWGCVNCVPLFLLSSRLVFAVTVLLV